MIVASRVVSSVFGIFNIITFNAEPAVAAVGAAVCAVALDGHRAAQQAVFQAMLEVPWVTGEGIPDSPTDGTPYAELLQAGMTDCWVGPVWIVACRTARLEFALISEQTSNSDYAQELRQF